MGTGTRANILRLVSDRTTMSPHSVALISLNGRTMTYRHLQGYIVNLGRTLRQAGVEHRDAVGIALPNGIDAAAAFLSVSASAAAAPMNPQLTESELEFLVKDLNMQAIVVPEGNDSLVRSVALRLCLTTVEVPPDAGGMDGEALADLEAFGFEEPDSDAIALLLHTSGTTGRPKTVPLRHCNLVASAQNIAETLALNDQDRCLNVMPLFHIHGLVASLLASIYSGGTVICAPGFFADQFFDWLEATRPTWYSAVPTMHQAILSRSRSHEGAATLAPLRFIRSSSASLPPDVMGELESLFDVPVIEAYGMTEASHQIASNRLPPGTRKAGSVGVGRPGQLAVAQPNGEIADKSASGEIVIKGPNLTDGYTSGTANEDAFFDGWFRTGDLGSIDADGYLSITGRSKEMINRGGETIAPREVDEVLLSHPDVDQALTFAVADSRLGEQVAAAVVPAADSEVTEQAIRQFAAARLSPAKVPRRIVFLEEIPRGPTGKLQRIGLAERLDLRDLEETSLQDPHTSPRSPTEELVASYWEEVLDLSGISVHDRFLDVGGDSILAMRLLARLSTGTGVDIDMLTFFDSPTIAEQATLLEDLLLGDESS
jgi:acyl-CoA synthetase (AMP-forming)/AMP-acid ligase II/aryl carrier-like protein